MKSSILLLALVATLGLSACQRDTPTAVEPMEAPVTAPSPASETGATDATGIDNTTGASGMESTSGATGAAANEGKAEDPVVTPPK